MDSWPPGEDTICGVVQNSEFWPTPQFGFGQIMSPSFI